MPSEEYTDNIRSNHDRIDTAALERARSRYSEGASPASQKFSPISNRLALSDKGKAQQGKEMQRQLSRLQKNAPELAKGLGEGKVSALRAFVGGLFRQIDFTTDWLFFFLFSFAFLKDIFDMAFAAVATGTSAIPLAGLVLGTATGAIGMIISFVGNLLFLCLVVTVLVLVGSSFKNRGLAKYILGVAMEFIAEALPGISLLPWTVIYVFILYLCVLFDRMMNSAEQRKSAA